MNVIDFSESQTGKNYNRNFKATFTDAIGEHVAQSFGNVIAKNLVAKKINPPPPAPKEEEVHDIESEDVTDKDKIKLPPAPAGSDLDILKTRIFRDDGAKILLEESVLKGKNKSQWTFRLICLYLYYKGLNNIQDVPRDEITTLTQTVGVYDANIRRWLKNNSLTGLVGGNVHLKNGGKELAKLALREIQDSAIAEGWKVGTRRAPNKKKKEKDKK